MIVLKGVSYSIEEKDKSIDILKDVNLSIDDREFLVILGHNGSGKTTLARLINGLIFPTKGEVYVDEVKVENDLKILLPLRQKVGMVFQNPDNQIIATTVEEDIAFGLENLGISYDEMHKRVRKVLKILNLQEFRSYPPHLLSGGQKQKIAVAGVLVMQPKYIIFDESTSLLDPLSKRSLIENIIKINKEMGIGVILITHLLEEAILADKIIVLGDAKIQKSGTATQIFSNPDELKKYKLEIPTLVSLSYRINSIFSEFPVSLTPETFYENLCQSFLKM